MARFCSYSYFTEKANWFAGQISHFTDNVFHADLRTTHALGEELMRFTDLFRNADFLPNGTTVTVSDYLQPIASEQRYNNGAIEKLLYTKPLGQMDAKAHTDLFDKMQLALASHVPILLAPSNMQIGVINSFTLREIIDGAGVRANKWYVDAKATIDSTGQTAIAEALSSGKIPQWSIDVNYTTSNHPHKNLVFVYQKTTSISHITLSFKNA